MTPLLQIPKPVLQPQPSTGAANGELNPSAANANTTDRIAPRQLPSEKVYEAAAYLQGYFDMRELARTKAHLMPRGLYERVCRVRDYLGWRYNTITLGGSEFEPSDWRSR